MLRRKALVRLMWGLVFVLLAVRLFAADEARAELTQMIVKLLSEKDTEFRAAGLDQIRTGAKGAAATKQFAAQLIRLDAPAQIALLSALADRGDVAARSAVLELIATTKDDSVRAAGIAALGRLGEPADLPLLIKSLSGTTEEQRSAAQASLSKIRGGSVSSTLATESAVAAPDVKVALLEVLAMRRARDAVPTLVKATVDDNSQVRRAAMTALGQIGRPEQLADMLPGVLKAEKGAERDAAERNVALVCAQIDNPDARGQAVVKALQTVSAAQSDELLSLAGRIGGKTLIDFVAGIATGKDAVRRKLGIDALSKWPDATVADTLLEITNKATDPAERSQAFQAFVKVTATRDFRPDKQRLERMKQALTLAKTPEEETLVIRRSRNAYDVETLRFVLPYVDRPEFAQVACETIVELAHHREIRDPNKAEFDKALDKVIATSKDPVVVDRAGRYKRGETWNRPRSAD